MTHVTTNSIFIFDANFFIALKEIHARRPYAQLNQVKKKLDIDFQISAQVFNELPFIVGSTAHNFKKAIDVVLIKDNELNGVKNDLKKKGVHLLAQDPDLTLIALAHKVKTDLNKVYIITDDFKLNQNITVLDYRLQCLPLPSFLQLISNNLTNKDKSYWKWVRGKVLEYNLDYMMARADIYKPQAKITWLIENAVTIADQGIHLSHTKVDEDQELQARLDKDREFLLICEKYIQNKHLTKTEQDEISAIEDALSEIQKTRKIIQTAKKVLMETKYRRTLALLKKANDKLNSHFQLMGAKLQQNEESYNYFERLMASEISKILFLRAYVLIENNKISVAMSALDQAALFATMARFSETVLSINYIKGILYIFNGKYQKAVEQFDFNFKMASVLPINPNLAETLQLKAIIGGAITNYLTGHPERAFEQIDQTNNSLKAESTANLMTALIDSGDYFLTLGFPEIASNLYSEALECAIDTKKEWKFGFLLTKLKRAYMASALVSLKSRPSGDISVLVDRFHQLEDVSKYNELMADLAIFTNKLYEPFVHFTQGQRKLISFHDLPKEFRNEWDCVKIQQNPKSKKTLLIGFKEDLGLLAFEVDLPTELDGTPEKYYLKLKPSAKIRIERVDHERESMFLIRAIIRIYNLKRDLEIIRKTPVFFKQMQI